MLVKLVLLLEKILAMDLEVMAVMVYLHLMVIMVYQLLMEKHIVLEEIKL